MLTTFLTTVLGATTTLASGVLTAVQARVGDLTHASSLAGILQVVGLNLPF